MYDLAALPPSIFDSIKQRDLPGKPTDCLRGAIPLVTMTGWCWYKINTDGKYDYTRIDEATIRSNVPYLYRQEPGSLYVIDIEEFKISYDDQFATVAYSLDEIRKAFQWVRSVMAYYMEERVPLGAYMIVPERQYWWHKPGVLEKWQDRNTMVMETLQDEIDFLVPSLYTVYIQDPVPADPGNRWDHFAEANITEAKRLADGRPIVCYLSPSYKIAGRPLIPYARFKAQIEFVLDRGCHVCIWDSTADGGLKWDSTGANSPYRAVLDVIKARYGVTQ